MATWTRKRTFEPDCEDWTILRDGYVVGRVFWDAAQYYLQHPMWRWSTITMPSRNGYCGSMEDALEKVRDAATDDWGAEPYTWPLDE